MNTNYKILSTVVDITQLLHENNCTYNESYKILQMVINELKQQQENIEYPTVDDYLSNHKTHNANNQVKSYRWILLIIFLATICDRTSGRDSSSEMHQSSRKVRNLILLLLLM